MVVELVGDRKYWSSNAQGSELLIQDSMMKETYSKDSKEQTDLEHGEERQNQLELMKKVK